MKAVSVQNPWATLISKGEKSVECRSWNTKYRGDLLICSSASPKLPGMVSGCALCIARLYDVTPFQESDLTAACLDKMPEKDCYAWRLTDIRSVIPFPVKGKLSFYEVDDSLIKIAC